MKEPELNAMQIISILGVKLSPVMDEKETKRLSRLTAILTELQARRLVTAPRLAEKYKVSIRTIYRDIRTLEQGGIPISTEDGRGYSIMEGYRIPPVMFTEKEAFSLITVEQIIRKHKDASLIKEFTEALTKIKSVLSNAGKQKVELLEKRMYIGKNYNSEVTSSNLLDIQMAIVNNQALRISYATEKNIASERVIEPYLLYHSVSDDWTLVAYCCLRKDFRTFRIDRIKACSLNFNTFVPNERRFKRFIDKKYMS